MAKKAKKDKIYVFHNAKGEDFSVKRSELKRAMKYLKDKKNGVKRREDNDCRSMRCAKELESDITLHCRQLPSVAFALRKAILRQDWKETVVLTSLLCQPGITRYAAVIVRACLLLLFHHPKSNIELLEKFIRSCTGYKSREEIMKFVKILLCVREEPLSVLGAGKYIRSSSQYRIIDDAIYKDL